MPFSDPKKKKAYMDLYNKKYYSNNSISIKPRSKINKKQLRKEKHDWLVDALGSACPFCGQRTWQYLRVRSNDHVLLPMPVEDQSWEKIRTHTNQARIICNVCELDLKRKSVK